MEGLTGGGDVCLRQVRHAFCGVGPRGGWGCPLLVLDRMLMRCWSLRFLFYLQSENEGTDVLRLTLIGMVEMQDILLKRSV